MSVCVDITKKLGAFTLKIKFHTNCKSTALFGLSGSGKSVTLKCIAGIIKPDSGKIVLNNKTLFDSENNINLAPQKRNIGYLPQNYALFPNMNVRENICCGLNRHNKNEKIKLCNEYIKHFQLESVSDLYPHQLSGGQQQRVALARALATNPELLLLDEPFSAMDAQLKLQLELDMMAMLKEYDGDTFFVSHNKDEVCTLCESVCVIENGVSNSVNDIESVLKNPTTTTQALLSGIENIGELDNSGITEFGFRINNTQNNKYKYVGISSKHIRINCNNCDYTFESHIDKIISDSSNHYLVLRVDKNSKPLLVSTTNKESYSDNSKATIGFNYSDVHYLK